MFLFEYQNSMRIRAKRRNRILPNSENHTDIRKFSTRSVALACYERGPSCPHLGRISMFVHWRVTYATRKTFTKIHFYIEIVLRFLQAIINKLNVITTTRKILPEDKNNMARQNASGTALLIHGSRLDSPGKMFHKPSFRRSFDSPKYRDVMMGLDGVMKVTYIGDEAQSKRGNSLDEVPDRTGNRHQLGRYG
ncbi:unnamed protein product [Caenorhabditis nigoni]